MFIAREPKRPRLGEVLDCATSSSDDEEVEEAVTFFTHPHVDQVPLLLVLGHWPCRSEAMRQQLCDSLGPRRADEIMNTIEYVAPAPIDGPAVYETFLLHAELGLAYLVFFGHRHEHYEAQLGRRWTRKSVGVRLEHVAHAEPRVCMSNPSGITTVPLQYAAEHRMRFLDLGLGTASYLRNVPVGTSVGGFELNANPLLLQQVLTNITRHCPNFCFVPLSFSSPWCVLPSGKSYVLFSWRPGSRTMPRVPRDANTACFLKGVHFDNMHDQGFTMQDSHRSVAFYTNFAALPTPEWTRDTPGPAPMSLLDALCTFDVVGSVNGDPRKVRAAGKSLGLPSGSGVDAIRARTREMPKVDFATWLIQKWRWKPVRCFILKHCDMTTRMLLSCGVPQQECRARLLQHLTQSRG